MALKSSTILGTSIIIISNTKAEVPAPDSKIRILKLDGTEFPINEYQMVAASHFLKRMLTGERETMIELDDLKEKQPCFDAIGLASAIAFAYGRAEIPLLRAINALAAANALEMWDMREAISEQLGRLAAQPKIAPFAISVASCGLEKEDAKEIVKQALTRFDEVIEQRSFPAISLLSFKRFISHYIYEHSAETEEQEHKAAAEAVVRAINAWCGENKERYELLEGIFDQLRPFCGSAIIDHVQKLIAPIPESNLRKSTREDSEQLDKAVVQSSSFKLIRATAGGSGGIETEPNGSVTHGRVRNDKGIFILRQA